MKRKNSVVIGIAVLLVLVLIAGRIFRQAKSDALTNGYSGVVSVSGMVLKPQEFTRRIEESGVLAGNKESVIASEVGGRVVNIYVEVGEYVREGEPLVRLDDELYRLESERAMIAFDKAKMDFERMQKLYDQQSVSESELEGMRLNMKSAEVAARMAEKTYREATIRAPFSGTVAMRMTEVGQMIERGMPVVQLVDINTLKLIVSVSEANLKYIAEGAPATVIVEAAGDTISGKVQAVGSRATTGTRAFPVEIRLPGKSNLRSGMFARAIIQANTVKDGLLLPRAATLPDMGRTVVYVARGKMAQKIAVRVIGTESDKVAVEGLAPGDTVLVTGNQMLSQGSPINLTMWDGAGHDAN